jgi:hypothetical protein
MVVRAVEGMGHVIQIITAASMVAAVKKIGWIAEGDHHRCHVATMETSWVTAASMIAPAPDLQPDPRVRVATTTSRSPT